MPELEIRIEIKSPVILGSGESGGSVIDTDIVYDAYGIPYFPAKRLKGLLRESALEILEMFNLCGVGWCSKEDFIQAFGKRGEVESILVLHQLRVKGYENLCKWIEWAKTNYSGLFFTENVLETFTSLRQLTAVDVNGIAKKVSLRTVRVLNEGHILSGKVHFAREDEFDRILQLLAYACTNLRHVGSMRTRGYGKVSCSLWQGDKDITKYYMIKLQKEA